MAHTRTSLLEQLHAGPCVVTFTKVNGEKRVMPCTLQASLLPIVPSTKEVVTERKENLDTIRVFCTDKQEWRSFRVDSVIDITT
jgi:hypothetical protein